MGDNIIDLSAYGGSGGGDRPQILTLDQLSEQSQTLPWLVKHTLPADSLGVMFGGSGSFKSFIALDMALHVVHGMPWLGKKTRKGKVLFIAAEGGLGLWKRIRAWHIDHGIRWQSAEIYVLPVAIDLSTDAAEVQTAVSELGIKPDLVVVDTLSQTFSGEENSAGEMAGYLRELGLWFRATWHATVLVIHHTGHSATERPRGSSVIGSNPDFLFGVYRDESQMLATMECAKQKDGDKGKPVSFALKVIELDFDEDGDPITTLVARAMVDSGQVVQMLDHEAKRGRGGHRSRFLELALNGIEEKKLRTLFYESMEGEYATKKQSYHRARQWAIDAGILEIAQGVVIRLGE